MLENTPITVEIGPDSARPLDEKNPTVKSSALTSSLKPETQQTYTFHAYHLADAIKLKEVAKLFDLKPLVLNPTRLIYELSPNCFCLLYNFGSVVFFNMDEEIQKSTLDRIRIFSLDNQGPQTSDTFLMEVEKKVKTEVTFDKVLVDKVNRDKIEIISLVLAQSTALEFSEQKIDEILSKLGNIISELGKPKLGLNGREIKSFIAIAMATRQNILSTLYLLGKPDETWENKTLDDLHQEATMMFELHDRFRNVDYKIKTIQDSLVILSDFASNRQHLLLEWAVVGLIVFEVLLTLFGRH